MANYKLQDRDSYEKTDRGWVIFGEITDRYGSTIRVQESSIAFEPAVWIFAENPTFKDSEPHPHLTPDNAKELIAILQKFIDASELEDVDDEEDDKEQNTKA